MQKRCSHHAAAEPPLLTSPSVCRSKNREEEEVSCHSLPSTSVTGGQIKSGVKVEIIMLTFLNPHFIVYVVYIIIITEGGNKRYFSSRCWEDVDQR